jgi:hypothetical protein
MLDLFIDRLSNWNPQLTRELKTRLNLTSLAISSAISLCAQGMIFVFFGRLDTPRLWLSACEILDREIWLALAFGGTYLIARDFDREIRSGTLDLVNLSPTKPQEILIGKTIGTPILIYWAVFLALPLHIIAVHQIAEIAPYAWVGDLVSVSQIGLLYLYALLATIRFQLPPILLSLALTIAGWLSMFCIGSLLPSRQTSDRASELGIYLPEDWWVIWGVFVTFSVSYFILFMLLKDWYPKAKRDRQTKSYSIFPLYLFSLLFPALLVGSQPLGMFVVVVIGLSFIFKAREVT